MNVTRAPIFMIQWSPASELDELASIEDRLAELGPEVLHPQEFYATTSREAFRESIIRQHAGYPGDALQDWLHAKATTASTMTTHDIASFRFADPCSTALAQNLASLLAVWDNAQTLYFSCHGTMNQLSFDDQLTSLLPFENFGAALSRLPHDCVTLVLGCCYGLNERSTILEHIPAQVSEVYGFTGTPKSTDVASLMLGVLLDQARAYSEISDLNESTSSQAMNEDDAAANRMAVELDRILDNFVEDPAQHVRGRGGIGIRWLKRSDYDGHPWQGRTIPLRGGSI